MYPLKFENIYFAKVWGGRDLENFRGNLPEGNIGESWDVACHGHGTSVVCNGEFKGMSLDKLIELRGEELLGSSISKEWFPLLIKLINSKEKLSVQVHPNDEYAQKYEKEMGKTEAWYVVDALEGASLIVGTKEGCTKESLRQAILEGSLEEHLNRVPIKKGDAYFIKSGLIHAICEGAIIAEIQQNSDTTYRVYDYGRDREIHVEKALQVIDLNLRGEKISGPKSIEEEAYSKTLLCSCKDFTIESYEIHRDLTENSDLNRFFVFTCVDGSGTIEYKVGIETIVKGDSIFIPATLGQYALKGKMKLLKSYV